MKHKGTILNGVDDNREFLQNGKIYALYDWEDIESNPDGISGAIQCGKIGIFDAHSGEFLDNLDDVIKGEFAHLQI